MVTRAMVITIGNPLRGDDGVAHHIRVPPGVERLAVHQLTPEVAGEIVECEIVVFVDADANSGVPRIEPLVDAPAPSLSHVAQPAEVVALARVLFGFEGRAYLCHIPACDFSPAGGLSARTREFAQRAEPLIASLL